MQEDQLQEFYDLIIAKLELYMKKSNHNTHSMASKLGFAYQPFYRLMTKKSPPTLYSLYNIAANLRCSISELTDDKTIFLDVNSYASFEYFLNKIKTKDMIRVYIPFEMLDDINNGEIFIILQEEINNKFLIPYNGLEYYLNTNVGQVFITTKKIYLDGIFLVNYKDKIQLIKVINASSSLITVYYNGLETQIRVEEITVIAKFLSFISLPNLYSSSIQGRVL